MSKIALKCAIFDVKFQNFLGGDTPEPPLPGGPTDVLRRSGRPASALRADDCPPLAPPSNVFSPLIVGGLDKTLPIWGRGLGGFWGK